MTSDEESQEAPRRSTVQVLSNKAIVLAGIGLIVAGVGLGAWLVRAFGDGGNELEAIKTAGTIVIGAGGAAALYLTARRQRSNELALRQKELDQEQAERVHRLQDRIAADTKAHQERLAISAEAEAAERRRSEIERRITELYAMAVDQLGADKASVRLAGLYALERLAQENPGQRQTIVNVLCAYLRMPSQDDGELPERQVRRAAQRILIDHLRDPFGSQLQTDTNVTFWADVDLDLSGAVLVDFTARNCSFGAADFTEAKFHGDSWFTGASFRDVARFESTMFAGGAHFSGAKFAANVSFDRAHFREDARFRGADFEGDVHFSRACFDGYGRFRDVRFRRDVSFEDARFHMTPWFSAAHFAGYPTFTGAVVRTDEVIPAGGWPKGWTVRALQADETTPEGAAGPWRKFTRVKPPGT